MSVNVLFTSAKHVQSLCIRLIISILVSHRGICIMLYSYTCNIDVRVQMLTCRMATLYSPSGKAIMCSTYPDVFELGVLNTLCVLMTCCIGDMFTIH